MNDTPDNMTLWNSVCETDPATTKRFKGRGGFQGTAVCAQSQRKTATALWGPFGNKWTLKDETFVVLAVSADPHDSILVYRGTLCYPGGFFGVCSEIDIFTYSRTYKQWSKGNDIHKKVRTDAMTKGLSELGFNADVFEGLFDDSKYVEAMNQKHAPPPDADVKEARAKWAELQHSVGKRKLEAAYISAFGHPISQATTAPTLDMMTQLEEALPAETGQGA